ncbi:two-component system response regulator BaeR [Sessilibacter sp. MAH1]
MDEINAQHILIVEDEKSLSGLLQDYFKASGFNTDTIARGDEVLAWLEHNKTNAVILDLMLPGLDGLEVCKRIRSKSQLPILITTAKIEEIDRLLGLELGADDYICKPYSPREVVARVKTVLRRTNPDANTQSKPANIELLTDRCRVRIKDQEIDLTATELALLKLLMQSPGRIYSRNQIMDNIYSDYRIVSERTIDSHIKKLRKKLDQANPDHSYVHSVYGLGYKFEPDGE